MRRWLAYLAGQLHGQRDLRWWHLPAFVPSRILTTLLVLTGGLIGGLVFGPLGKVRLVEGLVVGLGVGLVVGRRICSTPEPGYAKLLLRGRDGGLKGLLRGVVRGLVLGLVALFLVMLAVVAGKAWDLADELSKWVRSPASNDRWRTPTSTYRDSRNLTTLSVLMAGMVGVLWGGLFSLKTPEISAGGLVVWLVAGLVFGLVVGLVIGLVREPAWIAFVVISRWLAFRGKLPWNIMGFLDDAHRLGLLRTCGSVYQFRHAELQDHLAKAGTPQFRPHPLLPRTTEE
jgi:hypothetical protein